MDFKDLNFGNVQGYSIESRLAVLYRERNSARSRIHESYSELKSKSEQKRILKNQDEELNEDRIEELDGECFRLGEQIERRFRNLVSIEGLIRSICPQSRFDEEEDFKSLSN